MLFEFAPGVHLLESTLHFYGVRLQTRMTIVRLASGDLLVHSPTRLDPGTRSAVDALGSVAFLVSPNKIHNQALAEWTGAYPSARLFASPGLPERRPDLPFHAVLGDEPRPEWAGELDQAATGGNVFFSEILFLHQASRTLILADLLENIHHETTSWIGRALMRGGRGYARVVASPEFRIYTVDAAAAEAALCKVREWDFERIILAHGRLIESNARAVFGEACEELLRKVRQRPAWRSRLYTALAGFQ